MVRNDATALRKERLHQIHRMIKDNNTKGINKKELLAMISWNIGLRANTSIKYLEDLINFGKVYKDESDLYHGV